MVRNWENYSMFYPSRTVNLNTENNFQDYEKDIIYN